MCQDVIKALLACHEENPKTKFLGACNDEKTALDKCFKVRKRIRLRIQQLVHMFYLHSCHNETFTLWLLFLLNGNDLFAQAEKLVRQHSHLVKAKSQNSRMERILARAKSAEEAPAASPQDRT